MALPARGRVSDLRILALAVPAALVLLAIGLFLVWKLASDSDAFQAARREIVERGILDEAFGRVAEVTLPYVGDFQMSIVGERGRASFDAVVVGRKRSATVAVEMARHSLRKGWVVTRVSDGERILHVGVAAPPN